MSSSSYALDRFEKVMVRGTLIGAGAGMAIGLLTNDTGTWLLVGALPGAIFGYFDVEEGLWTYENREFQFHGIPRIQTQLSETPVGVELKS